MSSVRQCSSSRTKGSAESGTRRPSRPVQGLVQSRTTSFRSLADAVYKKCDDLDGLKDGIITDPRKCAFDPLKDLPKCTGDVEGKDCFTTPQMVGLRKVYEGVRNSKGEVIYPGQPPGAEVIWGGRSGWVGGAAGDGGMALIFGESTMRFLAFEPQRGKEWKWNQFDFDTDPPKMAALSKLIDAIRSRPLETQATRRQDHPLPRMG